MLIRKLHKKDIEFLSSDDKAQLIKQLTLLLFKSSLPLNIQDKLQLVKNIRMLGIKIFDLGNTRYKLNKNGTVTKLKEDN